MIVSHLRHHRYDHHDDTVTPAAPTRSCGWDSMTLSVPVRRPQWVSCSHVTSGYITLGEISLIASTLLVMCALLYIDTVHYTSG
eukprot:7340585-Pyramimonas_sp.AAC.1